MKKQTIDLSPNVNILFDGLDYHYFGKNKLNKKELLKWVTKKFAHNKDFRLAVRHSILNNEHEWITAEISEYHKQEHDLSGEDIMFVFQ